MLNHLSLLLTWHLVHFLASPILSAIYEYSVVNSPQALLFLDLCCNHFGDHDFACQHKLWPQAPFHILHGQNLHPLSYRRFPQPIPTITVQRLGRLPTSYTQDHPLHAFVQPWLGLPVSLDSSFPLHNSQVWSWWDPGCFGVASQTAASRSCGGSIVSSLCFLYHISHRFFFFFSSLQTPTPSLLDITQLSIHPIICESRVYCVPCHQFFVYLSCMFLYSVPQRFLLGVVAKSRLHTCEWMSIVQSSNNLRGPTLESWGGRGGAGVFF